MLGCAERLRSRTEEPLPAADAEELDEAGGPHQQVLGPHPRQEDGAHSERARSRLAKFAERSCSGLFGSFNQFFFRKNLALAEKVHLRKSVQ